MMDYTLIANSGIHLLPFTFTIDFNDDKKILFYETEDLVESKCYLQLAYQLPKNKNVYLLEQLIERGYMNDDHATHNNINTETNIAADQYLEEILTKGGDINNHPELFFMRADSEKHCKIEQLYNRWLPVPYYELTDGIEMISGPYNWCRMKIIPVGQKKDNKQEVQMILAFDTHSLYPYLDEFNEWQNINVEFPECPIFDSDKNNADKEFRFCNQLDKFFDFTVNNKGWVKDYIRRIIHPDAIDVDHIKVDKVSKNERKYAFLASYIWLLDYIQRVVTELPQVRLIPDRGAESVPVEMVIDIGNSRTAAVLFELNNTLTAKNDFSQVTLLRLQNFLHPLQVDGSLNRTQESFDMRIAFQPVDFGKNIYKGSSQFVWPSMVRLGQEAQILTNYTINLAEGNEGYCTHSSPKRYLWDSKALPDEYEWLCVMKEDDGKHHVPKIDGISKYFNSDGQINPEGFGYGVHYSRKTLMTLAFMEIIAQARVQINSHEYRHGHDKQDFGRFLDKIILTCPTGMSKSEQKALHDCLKDAIFVLDHFYQQNDQSYVARNIQIVPDLDTKREETSQWIFDEATCSQFVYLYGQLRETYRNCSKEFFAKYGKKREDKDSLIIGSLDIGAGTSDIMICRYDYNEKIPARFKPIPVFWDSFNFAGDDMLHSLIYNVLIQGDNGIIEKTLRQQGMSESEIHGRIYEFFGRDNTCQLFPDRILRRDFNLQVLVPIMYEFLRLMSNGEATRVLRYSEFFKTTEPSRPVVAKFKEVFGIELSEIEWEYNPDVLAKYVSNSMDTLLKTTAHLMYAFDCDLILLSGRPTSLDAIQETFKQYCAVRPDRHVILNKHHIGEWYPFADKDRHCVNNSKSVVPMGAMLGYLAANLGGYEGFSLDLSELGQKLTPTTENFVVLDDRKDNQCFITPEQKNGIVVVNSYPMQVYIGSKQFDLTLYPIRPFYELSLNMDAIVKRIVQKNGAVELSKSDIQQLAQKESQRLFKNSPLSVKIERPDYKENKEALEIESVRDNAGNDLDISNFKLSIQSLNDPNGYWLDTGAFNTNIAQ